MARHDIHGYLLPSSSCNVMMHEQDTCTFLACSVNLGHRAVAATLAVVVLAVLCMVYFFQMLSTDLWKEGRKYLVWQSIQYIHDGIYNTILSAWETINKTDMRSLS